MTAMDTQALLATTMQKIANKKEEKKEEKKPPEKEVVKGMDSCKYAMKVAEQLDYLLQYSEAWLGSPIERATKVAGSLEVPGILPHSKATGPDGKAINEKRDSMAVGEQPAATSTAAKDTFEGVPNVIENTKDQRPGGSPEKPSDPPLYNKTAYQKVLSKLASNKVASDSVPNELKRMDATESGKGQSGYDSGSSHGNDKRSLVDTDNRKAMDYTKGDAKKSYIKEQLSQVFDEVHPEKDTALDRAFEHGVDGAKMAGIGSIVSKAMESKPAQWIGNNPIKSGLIAGAGIGTGAVAHDVYKNPQDYKKTAGVEDAKKMKAMASKEVEEEKKEEKMFPGIHKKIEKSAEESCTCGKKDCKVCKEKVTKLAYIFRAIKEAEQIPTNAPAGSTPDVTSQVAPQMEQGMQGGEEDEIEKLKKMLLVMQMMKQQKLQEQIPAIDQAAPGAGAAADSTAALSGPTTGAV